MIILDTSVFAEILKPAPSDAVMRWLGDQDRTDVLVTIVTEAEILFSIESLPEATLRAQALEAVEKLFQIEFESRILSSDERTTELFAQIVAERNAAGRPISDFDAMVASIARAHNATLATDSIPDFEGCGVRTINPWIA